MHIIIIFIVILYCTTLAKRRLLQRVKKKKKKKTGGESVRVGARVRTDMSGCIYMQRTIVLSHFRGLE